MNPGSNLFLSAIKLIKPTTIDYMKYKGRTINSARQWAPEYELPVTIQASIQNVNRKAYTQLGLDFQKNYIKIYVASNLIGLERDASSDRFRYNGREYQMDSGNNWYMQDGWSSCIAVELGLIGNP